MVFILFKKEDLKKKKEDKPTMEVHILFPARGKQK